MTGTQRSERPVKQGSKGLEFMRGLTWRVWTGQKQYVKDSNICLPSERRQQSNGAGASSRASGVPKSTEKCFQQERAVGIVE